MITAEKINHIYGETHNGCGAAAFAMLFNIGECMARKACKTKASGTSVYNTLKAIKDTGLNAYLVSVDKDFYYIKDFLNSMSKHFPIYASCQYRNKRIGNKGGRDQKFQHAILIVDGIIYDSRETKEIDIECYESAFGKSLTINDIIIIDEERPRYGKSKKDVN